MDSHEQQLLADALRKTMEANSGPTLDKALTELGWIEMLTEIPEIAVPLVFRLLGETGAHASVLNDVVTTFGSSGNGNNGGADVVLPLPFSGDRWVEWRRDDDAGDRTIDPELPIHQVAAGSEISLPHGRIAIGWWLVGSSRAMLELARTHALDRTQFGRPIAAFQAVRHRLAEAFVAVEGAEATLAAATWSHGDELTSALAKAAAGSAALTVSGHAQQILGGIGFTAEHSFHHHARRVLILDCLLGSSRGLTREIGTEIRRRGVAERLVNI